MAKLEVEFLMSNKKCIKER